MASSARAAANTIVLQLTPASIPADGKSATAAKVTVTNGITAVPGDAVTLNSTDTGQGVPVMCTTVADGTCTASITSSTKLGMATITASDGSGGTDTATLTQIKGPASKVTVGLSPPTILPGGTFTATATATVTDGGNHPISGDLVTFSPSDPSQSASAATDNADGTYTATVTGSLIAGSAVITATDGSASGHATLGSTATGLFTVPSASTTNGNVTLFASINPTNFPGSWSGSLTFESGTTAIPGCAGLPVSDTSAAATCTASFAAVGSPAQLWAVFAPAAGSNPLGSASTIHSFLVGRDSTSTALQISRTTIKTNTSTTYTATVTPDHAGSSHPSGSVEFLDAGKPATPCTVVPVVGGVASCTRRYLHPGRHQISVLYRGDANFTSSRSSPAQTVLVSQTVLGSIKATMQWRFYYSRTYTKVLSLIANGVPVGATIAESCRGGGCPFKTHSIKVQPVSHCTPKSSQKCQGRNVDLSPKFHQRHLRVGARFTVSVVKPNWVGKNYQFIVRSRHGPRIAIDCLAPGSDRPGAGC